MITKRQFEDYMLRIPGTLFGEIGKEEDKKLKKNLYPPSVKKRSKKGLLGTGPSSKNKIPPPPRQKVKREKEPFFPEVDAWINKHVPVNIRRILALFFIIGGTISGIGMADFLGLAAWQGGVLGGVAGLLLIPLMVFLIKIVLFALTLAVAGLVFYGIYLAIGTVL